MPQKRSSHRNNMRHWIGVRAEIKIDGKLSLMRRKEIGDECHMLACACCLLPAATRFQLICNTNFHINESSTRCFSLFSLHAIHRHTRHPCLRVPLQICIVVLVMHCDIFIMLRAARNSVSVCSGSVSIVCVGACASEKAHRID